MSALGITQTLLATQLIEAVRKDKTFGIDSINLAAKNGKGQIEQGATADWIRSLAAELIPTEVNEAESKILKLRDLCDRAEDMLARAHVMLDGWQQAVDWHEDYRREFPEQSS
jgi:hypothetical protein